MAYKKFRVISCAYNCPNFEPKFDEEGYRAYCLEGECFMNTTQIEFQIPEWCPLEDYDACCDGKECKCE